MSSALSPNLAKAVAGQYQLNIKAMFAEAWQKVHGVKLSFWGAFGWLFLSVLVPVVIMSVIAGVGVTFDLAMVTVAANFIGNLIVSLIVTLLGTTLIFLMMKHVSGKPVRARMIFDFHGMCKKLLFAALIVYVFKFCVGFVFAFGVLSMQAAELLLVKVLVVLLGVVAFLAFMYVGTVLRMTMFLIIEKTLSVKTALTLSSKAIFKQVFKNILFFIVIVLFAIFSVVVTLGIGAIWIFPMLGNLNAIWYREIFSIEANM